ncbi:MAG TPA: EamA family transporter [Gammaproteobacteria bacterium]|jgi:drug/metabolite transporter (DMT)-like permease|nr:EamA family transporter [Gammaproteobacteria bacterium]HAO70480.1 EamA family transporter [Gammaproteobacteria bacterium]HAP92046.1 EamA family transporter [Gammaproteobacteria bacterium]HBQ24316.1 EamA family transporter [Gammaproteobacteria bacterium]HCW72011.1 EamA family transporter [Gammaproteobacteria bacterium]
MSIYLVFLSVVAIWSTTPLAIQWSTLGSDFNFAVASRMVIGLGICLLLLLIKQQKLNTSKIAISNYIYAGLGIFVTMSLVYYSSQSIPSGIISVVFGLTPIITGVFALLLLKESFFKFHKIAGLLLGLVGLIVIFKQTLSISTEMIAGLLAVTFAMAFQSFISVKLKQVNASISALETTTGALIVSVPLFILSWALTEGVIPTTTFKAALSIGYLALFGSVIGFMSYYYLIRHTSVRVVGIVPLITPIFALLLGANLNNETLTSAQLSGIILVLIGLSYYEYGGKFTKDKA